MSNTWDEAIDRFRELGNDSDAGRTYIHLLEGARARWESVVAVHPWRLDVLVLSPRTGATHDVQAEYRVRDGEPIVIFRLGPTGSVDGGPVVTGDVCRPETAPTVLDAFLLQVAAPAAPS